ncbi:hypothetical protein P9112_014620, partial [Eukaryota sp. TZLM1-RC]
MEGPSPSNTPTSHDLSDESTIEPTEVTIDTSILNETLLSKLHSFQIHGVLKIFGSYLGDRNGFLLADEMGLGKTAQAIVSLALMLKHNPLQSILIAVRNEEHINSWDKELTRWLSYSGSNPAVHKITSSRTTQGKFRLISDVLQYGGILLITHGMVRSLIDKLEEDEFDVLVVDEAHHILNPKSKTRQAFERLMVGYFRLLLSATPMKSDPIQFYRLISFIDPTLFTNETVFNQEYAKKIKIGHEKSASPEEIDTCIQLTNELVTLVDPIFIQRSSDLLSLPPKKEYTVFVPLSKTQCHLFNFYNQRAEIKRVSDSRLITTLPPFLVKIADTVKGDDYTSELQSLDFVGTLENGDRFDFKQFCRNVCKVDIDEMERKLDNQEGIDLDEGQNDDVEGSSAVKEIRESLVDIVNQSIDHSGDDDQSIFDDCCSESYKESQNLINDSYNKPTEDDINQSVSHPSVDDELQVNQSNNDFHQSDSSKSPPKPLTKEELFQALLDHSPKLKAIILLISDLINDNHSVLVFVQRLITIDVVLFLLQVLSIPAYSYEGCLSKKQRHKVLKHFIPSCNRHRPSVLVLTTACGSEGLTLVQADRVIIADIGLTPSEDIQAI